MYTSTSELETPLYTRQPAGSQGGIEFHSKFKCQIVKWKLSHPDPLPPTSAIFLPAGASKVSPSRMVRSGEYPNLTSSNFTVAPSGDTRRAGALGLSCQTQNRTQVAPPSPLTHHTPSYPSLSPLKSPHIPSPSSPRVPSPPLPSSPCKPALGPSD